MILSLSKKDALHAAHLSWLQVLHGPNWPHTPYERRAALRAEAAAIKSRLTEEAQKRGGRCPYDLDPRLASFARRRLVGQFLKIFAIVFLTGGSWLTMITAVMYIEGSNKIPPGLFKMWLNMPENTKDLGFLFLKLALPINLVLTLAVGSLMGLRRTFRIVLHERRARRDPTYLLSLPNVTSSTAQAALATAVPVAPFSPSAPVDQPWYQRKPAGDAPPYASSLARAPELRLPRKTPVATR